MVLALEKFNSQFSHLLVVRVPTTILLRRDKMYSMCSFSICNVFPYSCMTSYVSSLPIKVNKIKSCDQHTFLISIPGSTLITSLQQQRQIGKVSVCSTGQETTAGCSGICMFTGQETTAGCSGSTADMKCQRECRAL